MRRSLVFLACALLCAATASCKTTSSTTPAPTTAASSAEAAPASPSAPVKGTSEPASTGEPSKPAGPPGSVGTPPTAGSAMVNGGTEVSGDRTLADIAAIITKNRDKFRHCYDQAQHVTASLKGKYVLVFELSPSGALKSAVIDEKASEIKDPSMDKCVITELQKLTFPPSKQGKETKVSYPFTFTPGGGTPAK